MCSTYSHLFNGSYSTLSTHREGRAETLMAKHQCSRGVVMGPIFPISFIAGTPLILDIHKTD